MPVSGIQLEDAFRHGQAAIDATFRALGGYAGYGLRRVSFDKDGQKRRVLRSGERKGAATDRVRFCWGPQVEVDMVRQIYAWYLHDKLGDRAIAALLNAKKVKSQWTRPWTAAQVKTILTNEKYVGRIMFNRGSAKMSSARRPNPRDDWICIDDSLPPIVSPKLFEEAAEERQRRNRDKTDAELLAMLRALYKKHNKVTVAIIEAARGVPNPKYFAHRFGNLALAYQAAGVPAAKPLLRAKTLHAVRQLREATMSAVKLAIEQAGSTHAPGDHPWLLRINGAVVLKLVIARSRHDPARRIRWRIPIRTAPIPDFVLCVQMDTANAGVMGYYLLPVADFTQAHIILRAEFPEDRGQYRHSTLAEIFHDAPP